MTRTRNEPAARPSKPFSEVVKLYFNYNARAQVLIIKMKRASIQIGFPIVYQCSEPQDVDSAVAPLDFTSSQEECNYRS